MSGGQPLYRFHFDDEPFVDEEIDPESTRKPLPVKHDIDRTLARYGVAHRRKAPCQYGLIHAFEHAGTELTMQAQGKVEDVATDGVNLSHFFSAPPRLRVNITPS